MSSNNEEYICYECFRKYPDFGKYQTHIKTKHRQGKQSNKSSINQQQIYDIQDKIYAYLGELAEIFSETSRTSEPENLLQEHRFVGQANYLPNLIVRTPYEPEISVVSQLPPCQSYTFTPAFPLSLSQTSPSPSPASVPNSVANPNTSSQKLEISQWIVDLHNEIGMLCKKLDEERNYWEFADPLDTTIDFENQFSVLDGVKLIRNYQKRDIVLKFPEVTIFLVWIARVCKADIFRIIYQIVASQAILYDMYSKNQKINKVGTKVVKNWQKFVEKQRNFEPKEKNQENQQGNQQEVKAEIDGVQVRNFYIKMNSIKLQKQQLQRILQLYEAWVQAVLPAIPAQKKSLQQSKKKATI